MYSFVHYELAKLVQIYSIGFKCFKELNAK